MAVVAMSELTAAIVRKGNPITRYGALAAATYTPGNWVYGSAAATYTISASGTAASLLCKPLLVDFEPRISTAKARKDIDDQIATQKAPVIWGGMNGPLLVGGTLEDPGVGGLIKSTRMMISSTGGDLEVLDDAVDPTGGFQEVYLYRDAVNTDVVGLYLMY